jgi:hypothetical protein
MPKSPDNSQALAAFIARKTEPDTILARLAALSTEHLTGYRTTSRGPMSEP